jgi:hypothetical protein
MSVLVYPDLAQAILRDLSDFSPIELMSLARVCKSFRNYIKKLLPDYGVKQNLQTLFLLLGFKFTVDQVVVENGLFIFGSTLLSALHMRKGASSFYPNDLDVFYPTFRMRHKSSVPDKFEELLGFLRSPKTSQGYDVLEGFSVFQGEKMDFVVGLKAKNETDVSAVWRHVCRSDIPMCRSIYGKSGLKIQSFDSFFGVQKVVLRDFRVLSVIGHFFQHLRKFLTRKLKTIEFELPTEDVQTFRHVAMYLNDETDKLEVVEGKLKVTLQ